jgi:hypothetical protein
MSWCKNTLLRPLEEDLFTHFPLLSGYFRVLLFIIFQGKFHWAKEICSFLRAKYLAINILSIITVLRVSIQITFRDDIIFDEVWILIIISLSSCLLFRPPINSFVTHKLERIPLLFNLLSVSIDLGSSLRRPTILSRLQSHWNQCALTLGGILTFIHIASKMINF